MRVDLGLVDLEDINEDLALRTLADVFFQAIHFASLAADDDAGARGQDVDLQLVGGPLDLDRRNARVTESLLQLFAELEVLVQELGVLLRRVPPGTPCFVEADAETVRVDFLSHDYLLAAVARGAALAGVTSRAIDTCEDLLRMR